MAKVGIPPVDPHAATLKLVSLRCGSTRDVNESGAQKSVSSFVHRPGDGHRQTDRFFTSLTGITGFPGGRRRGGGMDAHTSTAAQKGLHMDDEGCVPRWSIRSSFRTPSLSLSVSLFLVQAVFHQCCLSLSIVSLRSEAVAVAEAAVRGCLLR